jgi:protein-disulfide isomerase
MDGTKSKYLRILFFVEIQVLLVLLIFLATKQADIEEKVKRTNQFLFDVLTNKNLEEISKVDTTDITIGNQNAPVSIIMYSKLDCPYCKEFFTSTFLELKERYINNGTVKLIVRYLTPRNHEIAFFTAKCSQYAYKHNVFEAFNSQMLNSNNSSVDIAYVKQRLMELIKDSSDYENFMSSQNISENITRKFLKANQAGIYRTPSFIINGQTLLGNRKFIKFEELILEKLNTISCE